MGNKADLDYSCSNGCYRQSSDYNPLTEFLISLILNLANNIFFYSKSFYVSDNKSRITFP